MRLRDTGRNGILNTAWFTQTPLEESERFTKGPTTPPVGPFAFSRLLALAQDRKSTRLNSSHLGNSYADFCLKKNMMRRWRDHKLIHCRTDRRCGAGDTGNTGGASIAPAAGVRQRPFDPFFLSYRRPLGLPNVYLADRSLG